MNVPYKIPLAVSTDGIAVNLGIQEPQSIDLSMSVGVYSQIGNLQTKEKAYTPTTSPQTDTITADEGFDGIDTVNISIDAVQAGAMMLAESYDVSPEIEINNAGKITARHNSTGSIAPVTDSGWLDAGGNVTLYFYGECEKQLPTQGATTITPTESAQTAVTSGKYTTGVVDVAGIPSNYVGSAVARKEATDMTASGATVTAPAGYYENSASKSVASGSATMPVNISGTGTITGTSSNSITVDGTATATPAVSSGYIDSGTSGTSNISMNVAATSTDRTISADTYLTGAQTIKGAKLQNKTVTINGDVNADAGYYGLDTVTVNVPQSTPVLETVTKSYTPTETAQSETVTPGTGYDGLSSVDISVGAISSTYVGSGITQRTSSDLTESGATVIAPSGYYASNATKTISTGSATPPEVMATDAAITTNGTSRITLSKIISLTPTVTPGYIASGTAANRNVILTANVPVLSATTYNASPTDQTIAAGTYIYGTQTIKGYSNQTKTFTANGTYTPDAGYNGFDSVTVNVSGGGGKNAQVLQSTTRTTSTSYTKLCGDITVAKTGTYDVYWTGFRSSTSGTWGTQLYIGSTAYGTAQTTYSNHAQTVHLSNVSLTANQKVSVYGRSRGSNYYAYVGMLTIIES